MNLVSRSIMVSELFHFEHEQVHVIIAERLVSFPNYFLCTGIELCSATLSVSQQPFSALYTRKVVAKGVLMFLNRVGKFGSVASYYITACA